MVHLLYYKKVHKFVPLQLEQIYDLLQLVLNNLLMDFHQLIQKHSLPDVEFLKNLTLEKMRYIFRPATEGAGELPLLSLRLKCFHELAKAYEKNSLGEIMKLASEADNSNYEIGDGKKIIINNSKYKTSE